MSARTRRKKPAGAHPTAPLGSAATAVGGASPIPMPNWNWRTFPVYFAFAVGGFLGLWMGVIAAGIENQSGNSFILTAAFGFWALLVGFGFSRFSSRWMMSRGWARPRSARKK